MPEVERQRKAVLVVDDNPDLRETMSYLLELDGYAVLPAKDGKEALELGAEHSICLILLDLSMPVMDGWEFLEKRKRLPKLASVPVIVLSAYASPRPGDADDVLQKPVRLDEMREIVQRYCAPSPQRTGNPPQSGNP